MDDKRKLTKYAELDNGDILHARDKVIGLEPGETKEIPIAIQEYWNNILKKDLGEPPYEVDRMYSKVNNRRDITIILTGNKQGIKKINKKFIKKYPKSL